eukprot:evm.model.scf_207EXC.4 EVM.evm.TU.scf_207EXC.4   scf_207EXC:96093-100847(+)
MRLWKKKKTSHPAPVAHAASRPPLGRLRSWTRRRWTIWSSRLTPGRRDRSGEVGSGWRPAPCPGPPSAMPTVLKSARPAEGPNSGHGNRDAKIGDLPVIVLEGRRGDDAGRREVGWVGFELASGGVGGCYASERCCRPPIEVETGEWGPDGDGAEEEGSGSRAPSPTGHRPTPQNRVSKQRSVGPNNVISEPLEEEAPDVGWGDMAPEILDAVRAAWPRAGGGAPSSFLRSTRLVNRHWYAWATATTTALRLSADAPLHAAVRAIKGKYTRLTSLDLGKRSGHKDREMAALSMLDGVSAIRMRGCWATDEGLSHLVGLTNLRRLDLSGCPKVTREGVAHVGRMAALEELHLAWNGEVVDACFGHLAGLKALATLDLRGCCRISARVLEHLRRVPSISHLDLSGCQRVTGRALACLAELPALRHLGLNRCVKLTDSDMEHVARAGGLQRLELSGCPRITQDGRAKLMRGLPCVGTA